MNSAPLVRGRLLDRGRRTVFSFDRFSLGGGYDIKESFLLYKSITYLTYCVLCEALALDANLNEVNARIPLLVDFLSVV